MNTTQTTETSVTFTSSTAALCIRAMGSEWVVSAFELTNGVVDYDRELFTEAFVSGQEALELYKKCRVVLAD